MPGEVWERILDSVPNTRENITGMLSLQQASRALYANTNRLANTKLLAMKLESYAQKIRHETFSSGNWERFATIIDGLRQISIEKTRFSSAVAWTNPRVGMRREEKDDVAMFTPVLLRSLRIGDRSRGFEALVDLIRTGEVPAPEGAPEGRPPSLLSPGVKAELATELANQISYLPVAQAQLDAFSSIAGLAVALQGAPGGHEITSALAQQMQNVINGPDPVANFDRLATDIQALANSEAKTDLAIALAGKLNNFHNLPIAADRFNLVASIIDSMAAPNEKAQVAAALIPRMDHLRAEDIVPSFDRMVAIARTTRDIDARAGLAKALAAQLRRIPQGEELPAIPGQRQRDRFDTLAYLIGGLPSGSAKADAAAVLAMELPRFLSAAERSERFDRLVRIMENVHANEQAKSVIAAALVSQLHCLTDSAAWETRYDALADTLHELADPAAKANVAAAMASAATSIGADGDERARAQTMLSNKTAEILHQLEDDESKATICVALATQISETPSVNTVNARIAALNRLVTEMNSLASDAAKARVGAALAAQITAFPGIPERSNVFATVATMMDSLTEPSAISVVGAALARSISAFIRGVERTSRYDRVEASMGRIEDLAGKADLAAALAAEFESLPMHALVERYDRLSGILSRLADTPAKARLLAGLARHFTLTRGGAGQVERFNRMAASINDRTDPLRYVASAIANEIGRLPTAADRIDAFDRLAAIAEGLPNSKGRIVGALAQQIPQLTASARGAAFQRLAAMVNSITDTEAQGAMELTEQLGNLPTGLVHAASLDLVIRFLNDLPESPFKEMCKDLLPPEVERLPAGEARARGFARVAELFGNAANPAQTTERIEDLAGRIAQFVGMPGDAEAFNRIAEMTANLDDQAARGRIAGRLADHLLQLHRQAGLVDGFDRIMRIAEGSTLPLVQGQIAALMAVLIPHLPQGDDRLDGFNRVMAVAEQLNLPDAQGRVAGLLAGQIRQLPSGQGRIEGIERVGTLIDGLTDPVAQALARDILAEQTAPAFPGAYA